MRALFYIAAFVALIGSGCSGRDGGTPLPRRYAYPRFEAYDTLTAAHCLGDLAFRVNAAATVAEPRPGWIDVSYPRYGAILHLSYTQPESDAELDRALANREERMMLNLGEATGEAADYRTPAGFACRELYAPDAAVTPLQFLAVGPGRRMISGAVVFADTHAAADSLAPVIAAMHGEVRTLLGSLTLKK